MIAYIIKSSLSLIIMFGLYWLLLRKEKLFRFNRFFLIFSILFSLAIPFITVPVNVQNNNAERSIIYAINENIPSVNSEPEPVINQETEFVSTKQPVTQKTEFPVVAAPAISFNKVLSILYFIIAALLFLRFLRNLIFLSRQKRSSESIQFSGQRLLLVESPINPYCFLNTIYVNKNDFLEKRIDTELLNHEVEHIKQAHSIDIIFMELIQILYWFNPVLILYNKAVRVNHEYLADNAVLDVSLNVRNYADILLNFISCRRNIPLTSGFNQSLTRKRLTMMMKQKPGNLLSGVKISTVVSLVIILFFTLSIVPSNSQISKPSEQQQQKQTVTSGDGVSETLLDEYQNIINKYKTVKGKQQSFSLDLTTSDKERLESIFLQMSKEQQEGQMYIFVPNSTLFIPKTIPTKEQYQSFKDSKTYGIWIDYKRAKNEVLNNYANTDFSKVSVSKLLPNAANEIYDYQVDLMTNDYYQKYLKRIIAEKGNSLIFNTKKNKSINSNIPNKTREVSDKQDSAKNLNTGSDRQIPEQMPYENIIKQSSDFSGKWSYNNSKSSLIVGQEANFSIMMTIVQKNDSITILRNTSLPDRTRLNNKASYKLDGSAIITKTGGKNQIVSAIWSPDMQSFTITTTLTNSLEGKITEGKRIETYSLSNGGKSLTVYYNDLPGNLFVSNGGEDKFYMVYDYTETKNDSPHVIAVFAGKSNGSISKNIIRNTYILEAKVTDPGLDLKYYITSFTFLYSKDNTNTELKAEGNKLTDEMKSYLSDMQNGQNAIFKDIKAMGPDGRTIDLAPIILTIER